MKAYEEVENISILHNEYTTSTNKMPPTPKKATVLVADDSPVICCTTSMIVQKLGYNSISVSDGERCVELLNSRHVDLLLLDIHMPKKDGIDVLSYIRDHDFSLPVIMISGSGDLGPAVESLKLGAYDYLVKPVDPGRLGAIMKNALSEKALREQVRLLSAAMAQSPLSIIITDPGGMIEYINPAFSIVTGYDEKDVKGRKLDIISSGQHSADFYDGLWKTISSGNVWDGEFVNRRKSGELFYEYATISPITDNSGAITHYLSIKQDISQRKTEQKALIESNQRFQELSDLLPQPVFECDTRGTITYSNRVGYDLFGYTREELDKGVSSLSLFAPEERERVLHNIQCRLNDMPFENHEYHGLKQDGTTFPMLAYTAKIIRDGQPVGIRGIVLDITERQQIEEKLQQLNQTLEQRVEERTRELETTHRQMILQEKLASIGQLAAGLAHELNNPINFVRMNFATLQENVKDLQSLLGSYRDIVRKFEEGGDIRDDLAVIHRREAAVAVDTLIDDIPDIFEESRSGFERIKTIIGSMRNFSFRHAENEIVSFDITKGIRDTLVISRNEYRYIAYIETELDDLPPVPCNPEQINQVFLNLVINSVHAIASQQRDSKGLIRIRTWHDQGHVYCSIADDGPGISPEVMRRIYEPFFTTKEPGKGTGLGLSISYDIIVQKHYGHLDVTCPPSGGTVFTIRLPRTRSVTDMMHEIAE
jgi:PAS domain S-box-containing protein